MTLDIQRLSNISWTFSDIVVSIIIISLQWYEWWWWLNGWYYWKFGIGRIYFDIIWVYYWIFISSNSSWAWDNWFFNWCSFFYNLRFWLWFFQFDSHIIKYWKIQQDRIYFLFFRYFVLYHKFIFFLFNYTAQRFIQYSFKCIENIWW